MNTKNKTLVKNFIEEIWNQNQFEKLDTYIHPDFKDHSLPPALPATAEGLKLWIIGTGKAFEHTTSIQEIVCEENKVMVKIKMTLNHIGVWRNIEPSGMEIYTIGYRYFKIEDDKISEHWGLIDGNAIEQQLKEIKQGCKIQE